jgi:hypothetical protein
MIACGASYNIGQIRIHTRQMPNLSWLGLLGHRTELKSAILTQAMRQPDLAQILIQHRRLDIVGVTIDHPVEIDESEDLASGAEHALDPNRGHMKLTTKKAVISGFEVEGLQFKLDVPVVLSTSLQADWINTEDQH